VNVKPQLIVAILVTSLFAASYANAYPVFVDEEKGVTVNVGVLLQPWFQTTVAAREGQGTPAAPPAPGIGAPDGKSPSWDFFIRRARFMAWGSVNKELSYFIETDQPNWGKGGNFASATIVQDAFITYAFMPEFKIDFGLMLLPFSHHTVEGATGLNSLDYHADVLRFPAAFVFRDIGVQFRGLLLDDLLYYRVGIFEGVRNNVVPGVMPPRPALNDAGLPRITGQLRFNLMGSEPDFFLKGIYFSAKPIVSLGFGMDYQPKAVYKLNGQPGSYFAGSIDVFAEYPFSPDDEFVGQANVYLYPEGTTGIPTTNALGAGGTAFFAQAGYRHKFIEPLAFVDYLKAKNDTLTILGVHGGVNFWVIKHTFNVKVDLGYRKADTLVPATMAAPARTVTTKDILGTVQAQVFF
jgi:hypothetical protein